MTPIDDSRVQDPEARSGDAASDSHDHALIAALRHALGEKGVVTDGDRIAPWLTDWRGRYTGRARAMVQPADSAGLAAAVAICAQAGVPLVAQGGNSGMVGGATPDSSGDAVLLSTRRMAALSIDAEAMSAECGAGVVLQTLHEAAREAGLRFPLSLGGKGSATVGGLISTNAGGTQVLRHGTMRALVQGIEVVLADGQLLDLTAPLKKDNRGFDLKQLWIGSEGTLGIVTRAVLKLVPDIADRRVVWAGVPDVAAARRLLLHCQTAANGALAHALEGFEVLPQSCLDHTLDFLPDAQPPLSGRHGWHVLLEFVSDRADDDDFGERVEALLAGAFEAGLMDDAAIAANETQAEAFWQLRENISPAEKIRGPASQHDISVAPAAMPALIERAAREIPARFPGTEVAAFGHLGDGNVHLHVIAPAGTEPAQWGGGTGKAVSEFVYRMVTHEGGSISAEHGIGQDKRQILMDTHDPAALAVMRAVKRALDPEGRLNPGKLV